MGEGLMGLPGGRMATCLGRAAPSTLPTLTLKKIRGHMGPRPTPRGSDQPKILRLPSGRVSVRTPGHEDGIAQSRLPASQRPAKV